MNWEDHFKPMSPFTLTHGGTLHHPAISYRRIGGADRPAILVLGGISAGRDVASPDGSGWWQDLIGPGRALCPERFQILGVDYVHHPTASIDTLDQARAIAALMRALHIPRLYAVIGSSYGGMVGMQLAVQCPVLVERLMVISAAHRPHPMATALRSLQRRIVRMHRNTPRAREGMAIARAIAMTTYRSEEEFDHRFDSQPHRAPDYAFRFPVEEYLEHVGRRFAESRCPAWFCALSESIDLHRVNPAYIAVPTTVVAVEEDRVVPISLVEEFIAGLPALVRLHRISSRFGHDAFLKEPELMTAILSQMIGENHG